MSKTLIERTRFSSVLPHTSAQSQYIDKFILSFIKGESMFRKLIKKIIRLGSSYYFWHVDALKKIGDFYLP